MLVGVEGNGLDHTAEATLELTETAQSLSLVLLYSASWRVNAGTLNGNFFAGKLSGYRFRLSARSHRPAVSNNLAQN
jgi:hypothetical protein